MLFPVCDCLADLEGITYCKYYDFLSDCKDLVAPLHGSLSSDVVPHGNHVIVSCHQGYTLSGERTLVCSSGYLSANIGTCNASKYLQQFHCSIYISITIG